MTQTDGLWTMVGVLVIVLLVVVIIRLSKKSFSAPRCYQVNY